MSVDITRRILGFINFFILQWFFIRLCVGWKDNKIHMFGIMYWVYPLQGWWGGKFSNYPKIKVPGYPSFYPKYTKK